MVLCHCKGPISQATPHQPIPSKSPHLPLLWGIKAEREGKQQLKSCQVSILTVVSWERQQNYKQASQRGSEHLVKPDLSPSYFRDIYHIALTPAQHRL